MLQLEQRVSAMHEAKKRLVTIFVTTGSHQLESIVQSASARYARLVVRVLPEVYCSRHVLRRSGLRASLGEHRYISWQRCDTSFNWEYGAWRQPAS